MSISSDHRHLRSIAAAVEWQLDRVHRPRLPRREWWVSGCFLLVVFALHGAVFSPLLLGSEARNKPMPKEQGAGSTAIVASAEIVPTLTLISLSASSVQEQDPLAELASRGIALPNVSLLIASPNPDPLYDVEEEQREEQESSTDEATELGERHAMLFGRYMGQVTARIDRAWLRPRSEIGAERFKCQTRIQQDRAGSVVSIELHDCNGDARWQRSLVTAIERSSPLSAPPEPSVFAPTLVLDFSADPYIEGVSNESDYEPKARFAETTGAVSAAQTIANQHVSAESLKDYQGSIELTIEGKRTTWTLQEDFHEPVEDEP